MAAKEVKRDNWFCKLGCHEVYADLTTEMSLPLVVFVSAALLHSVSAGGSYCAKTAKARAAALGLKYPGDHGAPDLSGPAPNVLHPKMLHYSDLAASEPNMASYQHNQPEALFDDSVYEQVHPRSSDRVPLSHETYTPEYTTNQMLIFPRGRSVSNPESSSKVVKQIALSTLAEAPGQSDLVNVNPRGHKPLSYIYDEHDLAFDESAPNRPGMTPSEFLIPRSGGREYHSGPINALGNKVAALHWYHHLNRGMSGIPLYGSWKMIKHPVHLAQSLYRGYHVPPFVQGKVAIKYLMKPKMGQPYIT
ncbi:uncharacterized protein LOC121641987 [Melanotaenia boesemani]|uniref:uncharacterized protein LOC121641987 n=1 Tax=Melanotaenia boesemani TaxID=1250792 RepID=UPI001C03AE8F|nr:uncharacterized protein LOC121641987 [Melanotaenia boesemani]